MKLRRIVIPNYAGEENGHRSVKSSFCFKKKKLNIVGTNKESTKKENLTEN